MHPANGRRSVGRQRRTDACPHVLCEGAPPRPLSNVQIPSAPRRQAGSREAVSITQRSELWHPGIMSSSQAPENILSSPWNRASTPPDIGIYPLDSTKSPFLEQAYTGGIVSCYDSRRHCAVREAHSRIESPRGAMCREPGAPSSQRIRSEAHAGAPAGDPFGRERDPVRPGEGHPFVNVRNPVAWDPDPALGGLA